MGVQIAAAFGAGLIIGMVVMLGINALKKQETRQIASDLFLQMQNDRIKELEGIIERLKESFAALSYDALNKNSEQFLKIADVTLKNQTQLGEETLENKKKLIDQTLEKMNQEMQKVENVIQQLEKDREQKFGEINHQLKATVEQTSKLTDTTNQLKAVLANTRIRGQWGERMAEDVLRLSGLIEGINYQKQTVTGSGSRPDFTFYLPKNLKVNMDVKFPLDNYLSFVRAEEENQKAAYKQQFLKDVKNRIKEVTTRDYINPDDHTVDFVMIFIPNEQVFSFLYELSETVFDEALRNRVVMCSPLTLFAFLVVIRQAAENYSLEQTAGEVLSLLGNFRKQWETFCLSMEKVGKRLDEARNEYLALVSTRRNQLEKPLRAMDNLRKEKGLPVAEMEIPAVSVGDEVAAGEDTIADNP